MQNLFTSEHQATIVIDTYRDEARRHDLIALARAGRATRPGAGTSIIDAIRERTTAAIRQVRPTTAQSACQPCVAC